MICRHGMHAHDCAACGPLADPPRDALWILVLVAGAVLGAFVTVLRGWWR